MADSSPRLQAADITTGAGVVTARVRASAIDEHRAAALTGAIHSAVQGVDGCRYAVIDLGDVSFINSTGIASLIELRTTLLEDGVTTILYRPNENLHDMLHKTHVTKLFGVVSTAAELEQAMGGAS